MVVVSEENIQYMRKLLREKSLGEGREISLKIGDILEKAQLTSVPLYFKLNFPFYRSKFAHRLKDVCSNFHFPALFVVCD